MAKKWHLTYIISFCFCVTDLKIAKDIYCTILGDCPSYFKLAEVLDVVEKCIITIS